MSNTFGKYSILASRTRHAVAHIARMAGIAFAVFTATLAHAEDLRTAKVAVMPLVADVNIERQIRVSGTWPHACGPMDAALVAGGINSNGSLVVRVTVPQTFAACAQVLTPYSFTLKYTPAARGTQRIAVLTNDGEFLGNGSLITRAADDNTPATDLTGLWYDPATNGSGVTFIHNGADRLFGTWYMYDTNGKPRWFSIQTLQWKQQGMAFDGIMYETIGRSGACAIPLATCPVDIIGIVPVGLARFTLNANGTAKIEALDVGGSGQVLFTSNLTRVVF